MEEDTRTAITEKTTWFRGLYMLLFAFLYSIAEIVVVFVAIFHFVAVLFTRRPMENLMAFGDSLSTYIYEILQYVTFNSDEKPFPFAPWPGDGDRNYDAWDDEPEVDDADAPGHGQAGPEAIIEGEAEVAEVEVEPVVAADSPAPEAVPADAPVPDAEDDKIVDFESSDSSRDGTRNKSAG